MSTDPIIITLEDLSSKKVEKRLAEQAAIARNREQADFATQSDASKVKTDAPLSGLWYNPAFTLTVFGILGGLLGWLASDAALLLRPTARTEAIHFIHAANQITRGVGEGRFTPAQAESALQQIRWSSESNRYLAIHLDKSLSPDDRQARIATLDAREARKTLIANTLSYGVCGLFIALCLSIAEPVIDRNIARAITDGSIAAAVGLLGGVLASIVMDDLFQMMLDQTGSEVLARAAGWGLLGLTVSIGSGLTMRSGKRLLIGVIGGTLGGIAGGILFVLLQNWLGNALLSRAAGFVSIGAVAGLCTGLIESASKAGWVKVTRGLIAGKRFILYRNPTYIGSGPECQIYLFKDPKVGRRHAAIHIVKGGFEIEDLPLGERTLVNGAPVRRRRLRQGDKIGVGNSTLIFQVRT